MYERKMKLISTCIREYESVAQAIQVDFLALKKKTKMKFLLFLLLLFLLLFSFIFVDMNITLGTEEILNFYSSTWTAITNRNEE